VGVEEGQSSKSQNNWDLMDGNVTVTLSTKSPGVGGGAAGLS